MNPQARGINFFSKSVLQNEDQLHNLRNSVGTPKVKGIGSSYKISMIIEDSNEAKDSSQASSQHAASQKFEKGKLLVEPRRGSDP